MKWLCEESFANKASLRKSVERQLYVAIAKDQNQDDHLLEPLWQFAIAVTAPCRVPKSKNSASQRFESHPPHFAQALATPDS